MFRVRTYVEIALFVIALIAVVVHLISEIDRFYLK